MAPAIYELHTPDKSTAAPSSSPLSHATTLPPKTLVHRVSAAAKATGSAMGIPGLLDIAHMIGELPKVSSGLESELADLGAHLEDLLQVIDPNSVTLHREPSDPSRNLREIQMRLNAMLKDKRSLSATIANRRMGDYERLSRQANYVSNQLIVSRLSAQETAIQELRLETAGHLESLIKIVSELKQPFLPSTCPPSLEFGDIQEENLPTVDPDAFVQQGAPYSFIETGWFYRSWSLFGENVDEQHQAWSNQVVRATYTPGMIGRVRVIRKSYTSFCAETAIKCAKWDLALSLRHSHPNFARLNGVVKDPVGRIRELVFTAASKPHNEFLNWVTEPAAFMRFFICMLELDYSYLFRPFKMLVDSYGHITAVPSSEDCLTGSVMWRLELLDSVWTLSRAFHHLLREFFPSVRLSLRSLSRKRLILMERVSHRLERGFTCLDVIRIARDVNLEPHGLTTMDYSQNEPLPIIAPRAIGTMESDGFVQLSSERETQTEMVIQVAIDSGTNIRAGISGTFHHILSSMNKGYRETITPATDGWYRCNTSHIVILTSFLNNLQRKAKAASYETKQMSELHGAPLDKLCTISEIHCLVSIENPQPAGDTSPASIRNLGADNRPVKHDEPDESHDHLEHSREETQAPLYFHRHPKSTSRREYWGFFSTSPNPRADCPEFPLGTDRMKYHVETLGYEMSQDYGIRYDKMVAEGLKAMPGSWES
ncbi:hypothetical protein RhiJN_12533 [Ceratobasidium sp. AG-Ba]|nr:hypothetical protein RhiJN_12533 [Ceratobasidium sp. AG-Ba]